MVDTLKKWRKRWLSGGDMETLFRFDFASNYLSLGFLVDTIIYFLDLLWFPSYRVELATQIVLFCQILSLAKSDGAYADASWL